MADGKTRPSIHRAAVADIVKSELNQFKHGTLDDAKRRVAQMHPDKLATLLFVVSTTYREKESAR